MLDGFALCHHPRPRRGAYVLAGHLHPCVSLGGRGFDQLRLPCFWLGDDGRRAAGVRRLHRHAPDPRRRRRPRLRDRRRRRRRACAAAPSPTPAIAAPPRTPHGVRSGSARFARRARRGAARPPRGACCRIRSAAPDWSASIAFRYRKRGGAGGGSSRCATSRRSGSTTWSRSSRRRSGWSATREQFVAGTARQQRAADRRARHRQELADQGLPERVRARAGCA